MNETDPTPTEETKPEPVYVSAQVICDKLNAYVDLDSWALLQLCELRALCNKKLADSPLVTVPTEVMPQIGLLGVLNSLVNMDQERVMYLLDKAGLQFKVATPESHPKIFGLMKVRKYDLKSGGSVEITTEMVKPDTSDPLYRETMAAAEANPDSIACGVQLSKPGEPGEIQTTLIPKPTEKPHGQA